LKFIHQKEQMLDLSLVDLGLPDTGSVQMIRVCKPQHPAVPMAPVSVLADEPLVLNAIGVGVTGCIAQGRVGAKNHP